MGLTNCRFFYLTVNISFMYDDAPGHFSVRAHQHSDVPNPNCWIELRGNQNWPGGSPDMNVIDFYLWYEVVSSEVTCLQNPCTRCEWLEESSHWYSQCPHVFLNMSDNEWQIDSSHVFYQKLNILCMYFKVEIVYYLFLIIILFLFCLWIVLEWIKMNMFFVKNEGRYEDDTRDQEVVFLVVRKKLQKNSGVFFSILLAMVPTEHNNFNLVKDRYHLNTSNMCIKFQPKRFNTALPPRSIDR